MQKTSLSQTSCPCTSLVALGERLNINVEITLASDSLVRRSFTPIGKYSKILLGLDRKRLPDAIKNFSGDLFCDAVDKAVKISIRRSERRRVESKYTAPSERGTISECLEVFSAGPVRSKGLTVCYYFASRDLCRMLLPVACCHRQESHAVPRRG